MNFVQYIIYLHHVNIKTIILKVMKNNSSSKRGSKMPTKSDRTIWKFYELMAVVFPIGLMLSHWFIFYVFSQNNQEVMHYPEANEICIAWIYTFLFLVLPLITLPASFLYRWCNLFRIPFIYFIFINVERWYYESWFCTNEMVDTHYILIYCIICIYIMELIGLTIRHWKDVIGFLKSVIPTVVKKIRTKQNVTDDSKYNEILNIMEEKVHVKA